MYFYYSVGGNVLKFSVITQHSNGHFFQGADGYETGIISGVSCNSGKKSSLSSENEQLRKIYEIGNTLRAERNIDKLLPLIMVEISKFLDADRATLFLVDLEKKAALDKICRRDGVKTGFISD